MQIGVNATFSYSHMQLKASETMCSHTQNDIFNYKDDATPITPISVKSFKDRGHDRIAMNDEDQRKKPRIDDCKHKCRSKFTCGHACCKQSVTKNILNDIPINRVTGKPDIKEWIASFTFKGNFRMSDNPLLKEKSKDPGYSKMDMQIFKKESQDSLHTILDSLGY